MELIFLLCENCVGLKVTQRTGAVQNVLSIFQVVLVARLQNAVVSSCSAVTQPFYNILNR